MRTTIDLPDALYRETKAKAALRGVSLKDLIVESLERTVNENSPLGTPHRVRLPLIPWKGKKKLDLSDFDFDDLLG